MKKTINTVKVAGYIHSYGEANGRNMLELKVSGPKSQNPGTEFIAGTIQVSVDGTGMNIIPVHFTYVTATYAKSGKPNPNFTALKKIIDNKETNCIVKVGTQGAAIVSIDGSVALNDFYTDPEDDKSLVSTKVIEGSFVNLLNELPEDDSKTHRFECDMLITKVTRTEADEETRVKNDFVTVRGAAFNFRNELLPLDFTVTNPEGMKYFENLDPESEPVFTKVWGNVNCFTTTETRTEDSAFGEAAVKVYERRVREWVITGTAKESYEFGEEGVLTVDELKKAMGDREVSLAENRKRSLDFKNNANTTTTTPAATTTAAPAKEAKFQF